MKYSAEIEAVHKEFMTYANDLIKIAKYGLKEDETKLKLKGERLSNLGFYNTVQTQQAQEINQKQRNSDKVFEFVKEYGMKYPFKFITEDGVQSICRKYNLIFGEVGLYKGFVPEKNLKEIEDGFSKIKDEDRQLQYTFSMARIWYDAAPTDTYLGDRTRTKPLYIAAPASDMETNGHELVDGYKLQEIPKAVPDPVVMCPVKGGYLILTAWGDEASDELVVNEKMN